MTEHMIRHTNRIVVKIKMLANDTEGTLANRVENICATIPGKAEVLRFSSKSGRLVIGLDPVLNATQIAKRIAKNDGVVYAEPDVIDAGT